MGITKKMKKSTLMLTVLAVTVAVLPGTSWSAVLEEVIVTAQKRSANLQDVPISINAVTGEKLKESGITRIADLQAYVPNLTMTEAAIGSNIFIRGVGSQVNQGFEQSVGTYVDGIYYGRPRQLRTPFFDLERVEVLRGPQGILFGKNSIGGALSLITNKPTDEFEGEVAAFYQPENNERELSLIVSGGLTDTLAGRFSLRKSDSDGFLKNKFQNRDEVQKDEWLARGTLSWVPTDLLDVLLKVEVGEYDTKGKNIVILGDAAAGGATPIVNDYENRAVDTPEFSENEYENYTLTINYQLGENTLTSISGFSGYEFTENLDADYGINHILEFPSAEDYEQFSQEVRLVSPGGEVFDYILGAFYQTSELKYEESTVVTLPALSVDAARDYGSDSDAWAVFGQGTWNISSSLHLSLGLRYTQEKKKGFRSVVTRNLDGSVYPDDSSAPLGDSVPSLGIVVHDLSGDRDEKSLTPSVNIQWDATETTMLYASASTGFKAGGFDARSFRAVLADGSPALEFEEEEALAFEVGSKMELLEGAAELNVALFRTEYEDLQVSVYDGVLGFDVQNAAEATTQGIEIDGRWQLTDSLRLRGAFGWTDFEFSNYDNGACYKGQTPDQVVGGVSFCNWNGNTNQLTPEFSANLSLDYSTAVADKLEFRAVLDLQYSDSYFAAPDLDPNLEQDAYTSVGARISIGDLGGQWDVALVCKNLTDEEIITFGNDVPLTGATQTYDVFVANPRTFAIQASYRF